MHQLVALPRIFTRRPLNRILVAQRISKPQMVISLAIVPLHLLTTYTLIFPLKLGYVGAALAVSGRWSVRAGCRHRQGRRSTMPPSCVATKMLGPWTRGNDTVPTSERTCSHALMHPHVI